MGEEYHSVGARQDRARTWKLADDQNKLLGEIAYALQRIAVVMEIGPPPEDENDGSVTYPSLGKGVAITRCATHGGSLFTGDSEQCEAAEGELAPWSSDTDELACVAETWMAYPGPYPDHEIEGGPRV